MLKFVIIGLLIAVASPSPLTITRPRLQPGRIVGGIQIEIGDAPHMCVLLFRGSHSCAASMISEYFALSAAHCTEGRVASDITLRAGSTYRASGGNIMQVAQIIQHPSYNSRLLDYDYCVLRMVQSFDFFSDYIQKIALPEQYKDIKDGTKCTVAGWGATQNPNESREALRAVNVSIIDQVTCNDAYASMGGITTRMICAGTEGGGKDACQVPYRLCSITLQNFEFNIFNKSFRVTVEGVFGYKFRRRLKENIRIC